MKTVVVPNAPSSVTEKCNFYIAAEEGTYGGKHPDQCKWCDKPAEEHAHVPHRYADVDIPVFF